MTRLEVAGALIYVAFLGLMLFGGDLVRGQVHWVIAGYFILMGGLRLVGRLWDAILVRREIVAFRSLDPASREEFLRRLWPSGLRYEYERHVDLEEAHEVAGAAERFPFPEAERRLHQSLFWGAALLGTLPATAVVVWPVLPFAIKAALLIVSAFAGVLTAWLLGRIALLATKLEVTPFNVGLIWPGGRRVSVPFSQPLTFRNYPAKGYVEVASPDRSVRLRVHYARLASARALALIWTHGGFQEPDAQVESSAT